ncbi:MAG: hypothetical protein Q8P92_00150 [Candidatus Daviesbacteria bacterium]|nr:hypothetical protein [Candidatus Daviesbacteria bacterium]
MVSINLNDDQKHQDAADEMDSSGNSSISGSTPDPESDDDTLQSAKDVGLYEDQDDEHPGELGIDQEIRKDELEHQKKD